MTALQPFFGFQREPFAADLKAGELFILPQLHAFVERFDYAVRHGMISVVIGDVGSGKSTSLRYAVSRLHPAEYRVLSLVATSGSLSELYRQLCIALGVENPSSSRSYLTKTLRRLLMDIVAKKQVPLLALDEAHLLRLEVFAELHTLAQLDFDSQPVLPIIFSGEDHLVDKLLYHTSRPLASRVLGKTHLEALNREQMAAYLAHHLTLAGAKHELFADEAITAIHQGSGGLLRRANMLARGALLAAAREKCTRVSAEHVRVASTEIL
jgi:general secretion pathway protein A